MVVFAIGDVAGIALTIRRDVNVPFLVWAVILLGGLLVASFLAFHQLRKQRDKAREEVNTVVSIILELEKITVTLNGVEVSIGRLFWGLHDFFARGLGETAIPQLLSSRFGEKSPAVWSSVQTALITELRAKKLIGHEQRPLLRGTETHFVLTDLGCEVLDRLGTKGWPKSDE